MKPFVKAIIAGCYIIVIGIIVLLVALGLNGWTLKADFSIEEFNASQNNDKIIVESSVGAIKINYYDGDKVQIFYPESKNHKLNISEQNGTVLVKSPEPKWFEFSIFWGNIPETVINLPQDTVFELDLTVNAGSLRLLEGEYSDVKLTINAGTLNATGVECETFNATVNAGSMHINDLISYVSFNGEVKAGSLTAKNVTCPQITANVSAGSLNLKINGTKSEYSVDVTVAAGSSNISNQTGSTDKKITADVSAGSLNISFTS